MDRMINLKRYEVEQMYQNPDTIVCQKVLKRYGGKGVLYKYYTPYISKLAASEGLDTFVDCFGGGATMSLLASEMVNPYVGQYQFKRIIYNDLEPGLAALVRVLKSEKNTNMLIKLLQHTPYTEEVFNEAHTYIEVLNNTEDSVPPEFDDMEAAYYTWLSSEMSFNANNKNFASRRGQDNTSILHKRAAKLCRITPLLERVEIRNTDYKDLLCEFQFNRKALLFLDPPYIASTRSKCATDVYSAEMWDFEHMVMLWHLRKCANWILCGYDDNDIYKLVTECPGVEKFDVVTYHRRSSNIAKKYTEPRTEVIWQRPYSKIPKLV